MIDYFGKKKENLNFILLRLKFKQFGQIKGPESQIKKGKNKGKQRKKADFIRF